MKNLMFILCIFSPCHAWFWSRTLDDTSVKFLQAAREDRVNQLYSFIDNEIDINVTDNEGKTALILACENGCSDSVHVLLTYNVDVNVREKNNGATALFYAARRGDVVMTKKLIMSGAELDALNREHQTALHIASYYGHTAVVELLLFAGANPNVISRGREGKTPLMYAARNGHAQAAKLLLESKALVNMQTAYGKTALMYASTHGHPDVVRVLLAYDADIAIKDNRANTAQHYASRDDVKNLLLRSIVQ